MRTPPRLWILRALVLAAALLCHASDAAAQRNPEPSRSDVKAPIRVSPQDIDSPGLLSSADAARRNRPPEPAKRREDLFYPEGFLTLSSPTPEPRRTAEGTGKKTGGNSNESEVGRAPLRPLDPSVETTPVVLDPYASKPKENPVRRSRNRFFFFAISIALAGLGVFIYNDFRYRDQLRADLVKNARLCSPTASPSDFDDVLAADVELTDPRAPSYVNPHFDADVVLYGDPDKAGKLLDDPAFDDYRFEVSNARAHYGPDLDEENFDFIPSGEPEPDELDDDEEFVVGDDELDSDDEEA